MDSKFCNRQKVIVNGTESSWAEVTSGVPQGSVLGPLIFVIYINDLPDEIKSSMLLFADDTKIYSEVKTATDQEVLQDDINNMCEWSNQWLLKYHSEKCQR